MALKAENLENDTPPLEPGSYPSRLLWVFDLGIQPQRPFQGQEKPPAHKIMVTYELSDEFLVDSEGKEIRNKPLVLSEDFPLFPLGSERAKSTKRYFALDPQNEFDGDFGKLVGTPIMLTVVQNASKKTGKIYNNVAGVSPMRKKDAEVLTCLVNPPKVFDLDNPDLEIWKTMHDWVKTIIQGNLKYQGSALNDMLGGAPPFDTLDKDNPY